MANQEIKEAHFNPETYAVVDKISGEEIPIQIFIERANAEYWEKAYSKTIAEYIGVGGNAACRVLAYLLVTKTDKNLVHGTMREIAEKTKSQATAVNKVFKALYARDLMKKVRNGCYFVSPHILRYGSQTHGAMLLRLWGKIK